jgi:hypothetical protein
MPIHIPTTQKIVCWTPTYNVDCLTDDPGTAYKDPLSSFGGWDMLDTFMRNVYLPDHPGTELVYVGYRDKVSDVLEHIRTSTLCIGYEGIGNVIARQHWKPLITFSSQRAMSNITSGPWAKITPRFSRVFDDLYAEMTSQQNLIEYWKKDYENR